MASPGAILGAAAATEAEAAAAAATDRDRPDWDGGSQSCVPRGGGDLVKHRQSERGEVNFSNF